MLTEKARHWERGVEAVLPANADSDPHVSLTAVSRVSAGYCTAVGTHKDSTSIYSEGRGTMGLLLTETAGHWAPGLEATLPAYPESAVSVTLHSVSCASVGNCIAVGNYAAPSGCDLCSWGLRLTEKRDLWQRGVARGHHPGADLESVSCAPDGGCSAGGYDDYTTAVFPTAGRRCC